MAKPVDRSTALWVLKRLRAAGFEALLAGGCVRDMLLKVRSTDYDVATNATPRQVKKLFGRALLVGAKFGVAIVIQRGRMVEVATFRTDVSYSDGRRPDEVRFSTAEQDALRRDFTINGMFYDPLSGKGGKVIDYVGGQEDLRRRVIRTIGPADRRFAEDYLRMIRAVRFAVRLGFQIAPATASAIRRHAPKIASISGERVFDELSKMLTGPSAGEALREMAALSLAEAILPELFERYGLWQAAVERVLLVAKGRAMGLALGAMMAELPAKVICTTVRRWGASNDLRDEMCFYCQHLGDWRVAAGIPLCQFKRLMASPYFDHLRALWRAEERRLTGRQIYSRRIAMRAAGIPARQVAPAPFVTGLDLRAMGLKEGPALGRVLRQIYEAQLNEAISTRRQALAMARHLSGDQQNA